MPTDRNWSKQHPRIRTPRPLVDRFNLGNMHPNKEWWRERRIAPATFMGFPDVSKAEIVGGSLYTEQMDAPTLAVIVDKCVKDGIVNEEFWAKFSWRTQQLVDTVTETDAAYLFRAFSRADFFDSHLALSLWGRIDWLLPKVGLGDIAVVVQGFDNPKYRNARYEHRVLDHALLLIQARDDWTPVELCRAAAAVGGVDSGNHLRVKILRTIAQKLNSMDLSLVDADCVIGVLEAFATLQLTDEQDAFLALTNDLQESGKLMKKSRPETGDEAVRILVAMKQLNILQLHPTMVQDLAIDFFDNIFRLSHSSLIAAVENLVNDPLGLPENHAEILLTRIVRVTYKLPSSAACRLLSVLLQKTRPGMLRDDCVRECLTRLAQTGVEKVDTSILIKMRRAIESSPNQSEDMKLLLQVIALLS